MSPTSGSFWLLLAAAGAGAVLAHTIEQSPIAGAGIGALGLLALTSGLVPGVRA